MLINNASITTKSLVAGSVSEFINHQSSSWNVPKIVASFTKVDVVDILKVHLPDVSQEDKLCWLHERFGEYSVRSGYRWLRGCGDMDLRAKYLYNAIWGCNLAPKLKHFAWRVCRCILPTSLALYNKLILTSASCPLCSMCEEDVAHVLVWCERAKAVWQCSDLFSSPLSFPSSNCVVDWFSHQISHHDFGSLEKGIVTMWSVWSARNNQVFDGTISTARDIMFQVEHSLQQYRNAMTFKLKTGSMSAMQKWLPPDVGFLKLNCDGSYFDGERVAWVRLLEMNFVLFWEF